MSSNQIQSKAQVDDDTYLKIWQTEQEHQRTRWTVVTFFMSISFAILGFSFQSTLPHPESIALRICGLLIYWFACILLWQFYNFTKVLRAYLLEMEKTGQTTLDIQLKASKTFQGYIKLLSPINLIICFGVIYTIGIAAFWLLGL